MIKAIFSPRYYSRTALCIAVLLLAAACQNVPKYKKSSGKFNEWQSYEGKHFAPESGTVTAVDPATSKVTIARGNAVKVLTVTPDTRIMHEATDIPLAQLPLKTSIKYTLSDDGKQLLTIWYGHRLTPHRAAPQKDRYSYF